MAGMLLLPWGGRIRRGVGGRRLMACGLLLVITAAGAMLGCGSENPAPAAQPKNYNVTLVVASGTVTNSTILHLTVQ
jgi:hypothetical protein